LWLGVVERICPTKPQICANFRKVKMASEKLLSTKEVSKHKTPDDCWIVVDNKVWDVTDFVEEHPGGSTSKIYRLCWALNSKSSLLSVILRYAGRDATKAYSEVHSPGVIKSNLPPEKYKGILDTSAIDEEWLKQPPSENPQVVLDNEKPPLHTLINSHDFELVASRTANKKTWAFYSSAATDLITRDANKSCFDRIWFRPRVLRNVRSVDSRTRILGVDCSIPLFVSPAAMAKLIHPDGECAIARACERKGIMQGVRHNLIFPFHPIAPG
jgi:L-lactate dehydrogenase (cytochrome)